MGRGATRGGTGAGCVPGTGGATSAALEDALVGLVPEFPGARLCVALSGGVDSVALLALSCELAARHPSLGLRAIHVDHGLQAQSSCWSDHCQALCRQLGVPLEVIRLALAPRAGASVEAEARTARYAAIAARLEPGECLLTAHHQDDQLETLLLQLARGAGVHGLAAMPRAQALGRGRHLRPLLEVGRDDLVARARAAGLDWVEDPMNTDLRFDRAWLRHQVLPGLRDRWPAIGRTVSRSAGHLAEARGLLEDLAAIDAAGRVDGARLSVEGLRGLPRARQVNLLRWWLARQGLGMPSAARLGAVIDDVLTAGPAAAPVVRWGDGEVRRYRGWIHALVPLAAPLATGTERLLGPGQSLDLGPGLGTLALVATRGEGLARARLAGPLTLRARCGGERLRLAAGAHKRSLKNLFQEAGIVPWMRPRVPVLWHAGEPVAVGDLWIDAQFAAGPGEDALAPRWSDHPPLC